MFVFEAVHRSRDLQAEVTPALQSRKVRSSRVVVRQYQKAQQNKPIKTAQICASVLGLVRTCGLLLHFVVSGASFFAGDSERFAGRLRFVAKALDLDVAQGDFAALIYDCSDYGIRRLVVSAPPTFDVVARNGFEHLYVLNPLEGEHLVDYAVESEEQVIDLSAVANKAALVLLDVSMLLLVVFGELFDEGVLLNELELSACHRRRRV